MIGSFFLVTVLFTLTYQSLADDIIVTLPNGQVRGREMKTSNEDKAFFGFQGIPFAEPPVGDLRFQAPMPAKNWNGILDATQERGGCISSMMPPSGFLPNDPTVSPVQTGIDENSESEDCLYLNVYTPKLTEPNSTDLLPVMFWIYGGGFITGSASYSMYGPDFLIEEDVILVSSNYRLGPFGFLTTLDEVVPGNAGLKDQNLALKWTYENIHLFGGDPNKITIFGQSVGSMSVSLHVFSEKSAGLFSAAIGHSGSGIASSVYFPNGRDYAFTLLNNIAQADNIEIDNTTITTAELLDILKNQTVESIKTAAQNLSSNFGPCIEVPHDGAFLTESNFEILESGRFNKVPMILGFTSEEYLMFTQGLEDLAGIAQTYDEDINNVIPWNLYLNDTTNKSEVARAIKRIYLNDDQLYRDNLGAVIKIGSDNKMTRSSIKQAIIQSKFTNLYFYQFSYHGKLGMEQNLTVDGLFGNVGHTEELPYIFRMAKPNTTDLSIYPEQDILVHSRFLKLWTNFAKYRNPTPETTELLQNIVWPTVKETEFQYLNISENLEVIHKYPRGDTFHQWNTIYTTYGVQPFYSF